MSGTQSALGSIVCTIASGQTDSTVIDATFNCADAVCICVQSPAALTGTLTFQVSNSPDLATAVFATLQDDTPANIAGPAAGMARQYTKLVGWKYWKIVSSGAEGSTRTFLISKQYTA